MLSSTLNFAESSGSSGSGGISALGLNVKAFIFQLVAFLIVLLVLKRYVFPRLVTTLEQRRKTLEDSLEHAKQTEQALNNAEKKATQMLAEARVLADEALLEAKKAASAFIAEAESTASTRASLIIKDAEAHLDQEREKLRHELKNELKDLVADATQTIIGKKLDSKSDTELIKSSIKEIK